MDLRQLAALIAVAETGTFSAAADRLHTVQSNVSTHIARLERELGVTLVDRSAGRLTDEGVIVVERARRVQGELDALHADVASLRDEVAGSARLGVIGTTGRWLVAPLLTAMETAHPKVAIRVLEGNTTSLLPQLQGGNLDLAVVSPPESDPDVAVEPLFHEELIVLAPLGHPLAEVEVVTLAELADHPLLLPPPGASIRAVIDRAAAAEGVVLRPKAEVDGLRLVASLSFEGFGPAIVPASAAPGWLRGDWRRVAIAGLPPRRVDLARRKRGMLSAPARALAVLLRQVVQQRANEHPGLHPIDA